MHPTFSWSRLSLCSATKKIQEVIGIIVKGYQPEKIILFGSQASGQADAYSDVDLIIIKKTRKRFIQRLLAVPSLPVPADIFVYTPEEFARMKKTKILSSHMR